VTTPIDDDPEAAWADLTPVTVRCVTCRQEWEEFKEVADHMFTPLSPPAASPIYTADRRNCVFCNATPGDTWRQGPYL
jgi:hypothetical protein